jgi:hypothetical protein
MFKRKFLAKFQEDFTRSLYFQNLFSALMLLSLIEEFRLGHHNFKSLIWVAIVAYFLRIFYKSLQKLLYTFWTMTFVFSVYCLYGLIKAQSLDSSTLLVIYLIALLILVIQSYVLSSPIYYPQVRWWEYDFRYRHDLKVSVECEGINVEGRLTDLRRGAACVLSFEDFSVGSTVEIKYISAEEMLIANAEIVSKREYSIGRGISYGIRFQFKSKEQKLRLREFSKLWTKEQKQKIDLKIKRV